jgi:pSer/pThr/pTyr-binding forkhead associated (FHA) protein
MSQEDSATGNTSTSQALYRVVFLNNTGGYPAGTELPISDLNATIGSAAENTLSFPEAEGLAAQHARLQWDSEKGTVKLFDLNSLYGSFVNNHRILQPITLKEGDQIR